MKLVFDDLAIADLENIFGWIAQDIPGPRRPIWEAAERREPPEASFCPKNA